MTYQLESVVSTLIPIHVYKQLSMEQLCYVILVQKDTYLQVLIKVVCLNVLQIIVAFAIKDLIIIVNNVLMDFTLMIHGNVQLVLLQIVKLVRKLFALIVLMVIDQALQVILVIKLNVKMVWYRMEFLVNVQPEHIFLTLFALTVLNKIVFGVILMAVLLVILDFIKQLVYVIHVWKIVKHVQTHQAV